MQYIIDGKTSQYGLSCLRNLIFTLSKKKSYEMRMKKFTKIKIFKKY